MDIQAKKIHFVQEFLRIQDENLVDKLSGLLKTERISAAKNILNPISLNEFNTLIDSAENDFRNGKITSGHQLINEIDLWM